jgi:hypothetical protein
MKSLKIMMALLLGWQAAFCQTAVKVSGSLGYVSSFEGRGRQNGALIAIEPTYRVNDRAIVGLRFEEAFFGRGIGELKGVQVAGQRSSILSYNVFGQHYFLTGANINPFVGFGLGLYTMSSVKLNSDKYTGAGVGTTFGFFPRIGVEISRYRISADYNYITPSQVHNKGWVYNSYLAVQVTYIFGKLNPDEY